MSRLLRKTLAQLPAQVGGSLAYFVAMIAWTHWLTPKELGTFAMVTAIQELMLVVAYSWWSITTLRYLTSYDDPEARRRFDQTDMSVMIYGGVIQAALVLGAVLFFVEGTRTLAFASAAVAFSLTRNIAGHLTNRVRAELDSVNLTVLQLVGPIGGLALGLAMFHLGWANGVETVLWSYTLAQVFSIFWAARRLTFTSIVPRPDGAMLRQGFAFGIPSMMGSIFSWVSINGIRFIVGFLANAAAVGLVTVGWWLGHRMASFASLVVVSASFSVAVERIREVGHKAALPQVAANGALLLGVLAPALTGGLAVSDRFVDLFVANDFVTLTLVILPIALVSGVINEFGNHVSAQAFLLFEKPGLEVYISGTEAVASVVLCVVGYRLFGPAGAALGCLIAKMVAVTASMIVAHRLFGLYLKAQVVLKIVFSAMVMGLAVAAAPIPGGLSGLLVAVGLGVGVYGFLIIVLFRAEISALLRPRVASDPA